MRGVCLSDLSLQLLCVYELMVMLYSLRLVHYQLLREDVSLEVCLLLRDQLKGAWPEQ